MISYELEEFYRNKIANLEKEIRSLKSEYQAEHKRTEDMARQIEAQKRIIEKRNSIIKLYVTKYGRIEEEE